jgi:hypothetical protein
MSLSIIDLECGRQPRGNEVGIHSIVRSGEIRAIRLPRVARAIA